MRDPKLLSVWYFGKVMCMIMPFLIKRLVCRIFSERPIAQHNEAMFFHANSSASLINVVTNGEAVASLSSLTEPESYEPGAAVLNIR